MDAKHMFYSKDKVFTKKEEMLFASEELAYNITEDVLIEMEDQNMNRKQLSDKLGCSKSHISQLLNGVRNLTLKSLSDIAFVLGYKVDIKFKKMKDNAKSSQHQPTFKKNIKINNNIVPFAREYVKTENCENIISLKQAI